MREKEREGGEKRERWEGEKVNEKERQECKLKLARLHNSILYAILSIDNARSCIIHFLLSAQANTDKRVEREREREREREWERFARSPSNMQ